MRSIVKTGQKGVTFANPTKYWRGYNLYAAFGTTDAFLMDMEGNYVNWWRLPYPPGCHGILLPNGHYVYAGRIKTREELGYGWTVEFGGLGGVLIELDWDGSLVWQAEAPCQGHDFTVLPNGHIIYIAWEPKANLPDHVAAKVKGGRPGTELNGKIWGDIVVEIDRNGRRVWEWVAHEHLDPDIDVLCPFENRSQWPYINSVFVCRDGNILLSTRYLNQVTKISYKTGEVLARYGKGKIFHQHDARELGNGNILVLDNGTHRHEYAPEHSRSVEIDPATDEIVWEYKANPPSDFFSSHSSGNERQPNGNTVIVETDKGRAFEVTREGEIVWEFVNPRYAPFIGRSCNMIWRFHRYAPDYQGLKGKDLNPARFPWLNRTWGPNSLVRDIQPCSA